MRTSLDGPKVYDYQGRQVYVVATQNWPYFRASSGGYKYGEPQTHVRTIAPALWDGWKGEQSFDPQTLSEIRATTNVVGYATRKFTVFAEHGTKAPYWSVVREGFQWG